MNILPRPASNLSFMHWFIPFLCFGLIATPALAKTPTVLFLGDSLTAGYGLTRSEAYPALLSKKAQTAGLKMHVINAGVSGGTTAGGLARLPHLLHQSIDVLVIELGVNDAFRNVPVAQIEANLQKIIDLTRARYPQVKIVLVGMQLPQHSEDDYVTRFGAMYAELARRNHTAFVPFLLAGVLGNPALNLPDFIHPNASGQEVLAENVWPVLERVLKS
jgi:acyl-CoA thioesterase-1